MLGIHISRNKKSKNWSMNVGSRHYQSIFFSSSLSKRKGSWLFYVDYRALDHLTTIDRFLTPTVDELIYELHRPKCFNKLELKSGNHQI